MSPTYRCPKGHASSESDYCDTCGAAISAPAPSPSADPAPDPVEGADPVSTGPAPMGEVGKVGKVGQVCPVCATPRAGTDRFCESDGFDFTGAQAQQPAAAVAVPGPVASGAWIATVEADRAYYDRTDSGGVDFPAVCPPRAFALSGTQLRIGRRSESKGIAPELDLSGPPLDPGISHLHAVLSATGEGWSLIDPGSTNGTTLNDAAQPLAVGVSVPLKEGDRIHVGAWTTITVRRP
jgi:hypothetical protein